MSATTATTKSQRKEAEECNATEAQRRAALAMLGDMRQLPRVGHTNTWTIDVAVYQGRLS